MNTDIRIATTFPDHPKAQKLIRRLGASSILCLVRLWLYTAANKPDGHLAGVDDDDVEIAAKFAGVPGAFVKALVDVKFLDRRKDGSLDVHDWVEHQPWASQAAERSARARRAAEARWAKSDEEVTDLSDAPSIEINAPSIAPSTKIDAPSIAPSTKIDAPSMPEASKIGKIGPKEEAGKKPDHAPSNAPSIKIDAPSIEINAPSNAHGAMPLSLPFPSPPFLPEEKRKQKDARIRVVGKGEEEPGGGPLEEAEPDRPPDRLRATLDRLGGKIFERPAGDEETT